MYDVCVIGGGAAGIAAALSAYHHGGKRIIIIDRDGELGGILQQCIHNGFGLHYFKEELSGPSYAERFVNQIENTPIEILVDTSVIKITKSKEVHYLNKEGYHILNAQSIILASGCRERSRHHIDIPGSRVAGIYTAGLAQKYLNRDGYLVGRNVFILGSGDIGLIMARRLTLEGAKVLGVAEIQSYSNGLKRNLVQCLDDFNIPLYLEHTVTKIMGDKRVTGIEISRVDDSFQPIKNTEKLIPCDTLLLSIGLIPETQLLKDIGILHNPITHGPIVDDTYQTSCEGIYACGNALHVHDLVDHATIEGAYCGKCAIEKVTKGKKIPIEPKNLVRYVVPNYFTLNDDTIDLKFRVSQPIDKGTIIIRNENKVLKEITKEHIAPQEMELIHLDKRIIPLDTHYLSVEVREWTN